MAITNTNNKIPDAGSWVKGCFTIKVGNDFKTFKDIMAYAQQDELFGSNSTPGLDPGVKKVLDAVASSDKDSKAALPEYFSHRKCRDSSLGGNDAINPLPQFGVDDDIVPDHLEGADRTFGMGQIYSENYDDFQQILYLGFGIPLFSNVTSFWAGATDLEMANFVNQGKGITLEKIGYLLGSAPVRILKIATVPYRFLWAVMDGLQKVPISKYYTFSSEMPMYFRFVNTILVMLATNMNIMGSNQDFPDYNPGEPGTTNIDLLQQGTSGGDLSGISTVFRDHGLDMARIMTKRYLYEHGKSSSMKNRFTDDAVIKGSNANNGEGTAVPANDGTSTAPTSNSTNSTETTQTDTSNTRMWEMSWVDKFKAAYMDAIYDGHLFIGFRIDKGMGGSESFSNTVGESKISATINESFQSASELNFQMMGGDIGSSGLADTLTGVIGAAKGVLEGLTSAFSLDPLAAMASGSAQRIDIPEVWLNSSYSRSQAFTLTCISPYGDMESIFQSEYVPLACMLAGTLPRGTGNSSHSAPFVCQAYCRGIFSSPLCIIESLEVIRGADQFSMSAARLPLKISMHVTLKDLTPVMYMSMGGNSGFLNAIMGTDDNFGEYMLTLSGMGLRDRLAPFRAIRRKLQILLDTAWTNKLSPFQLGMEGGSKFLISRAISTFVSSGKSLPQN